MHVLLTRFYFIGPVMSQIIETCLSQSVGWFWLVDLGFRWLLGFGCLVFAMRLTGTGHHPQLVLEAYQSAPATTFQTL